MTGFDIAALGLIALLPGALFVWSFERWAGRFGIGLQDRALRFLGGSAVLLSISSWPLYWLYSNYWQRFANGEALPWSLSFVPILYTVLPLVSGSLLGFGWNRDWRWARLIGGKDRAPRAWDRFFQDRPVGWIRCKLKSGTWIAGSFGVFGGRSPYAAGYPEPPDLYLTATLVLDPQTGALHTEEGDPVIRDSAILIRWEEIEYLEFVEDEEEAGDV